MKATLNGIRIAALTASVPSTCLDLRSLSTEWGTEEIERIIRATGIAQVRVAPRGMTTSDLCADAANRLFHNLDVSPDSIDAVVFVSQTPDYLLPATSVSLQARLNLNREVLAFDINYGCSGFVYGLLQSSLLITSEICERVLLLVGDTTTQLVGPRDRSVRMVFGDAGAAAIVEKGKDRWSFRTGTDGGGARSLMVPAGGARLPRDAETAREQCREEGNYRSLDHLYMDGMAVMNFALQEVPACIDELLRFHGWEKGDVQLFALHQANAFMTSYLRRKMTLSEEQVPFALGQYGNSGSATIPMMLSALSEKLRARPSLHKIVFCGFGSGLSWAAAAGSLAETRILDIGQVESGKEHFHC